MFHAHIIPIVTCFIHTLYHFYAFSRTNLLTSCHSASCLFSAVFGFRKVIKAIFSELDEMKTQSPIFPDTFMETKGESEEGHGATTPCGGAHKYLFGGKL